MPDREQALPILALLLVLGLFLVSSRPSLPFVGNQHTYLPHGLRQGGAEFLEADWFANTRPPHWLFSRGVAIAERADATATSMVVARTAVQSALWLGLAAFALAPRRGRRRAEQDIDAGSRRGRMEFTIAGALALLAYVLLVRRIGLPEVLHPGHSDPLQGAGRWALLQARDLLAFSGVAGQTLHSDAVEPASFGAFALLGLGLFRLDAWRSGAVAFAIAGLAHPTYLPHGGLAVTATAAVLWRQGFRSVAWQCLALFAALSLPSALDAAHFAAAAARDPEALRILATERVAHHAVPAHWFDTGDLLRFFAIALGLGLLLRDARPAEAAGALTLGVAAAAGVALAWATGSFRLGLVFPWRSTVMLFPIAAILCMRSAIRAALDALAMGFSGGADPTDPPARPGKAAGSWAWAAIAAAAFTLLALSVLKPRSQFQAFPDVDAFANRVRESAPKDASIVVPGRLYFQSFRLRAERPIFVDFKSHPYWPSEIHEWRRRVQWARRFQELPPWQRLIRCGESGATHYVVHTRTRGVDESPVVQSNGFSLIECPRSPVAPVSRPLPNASKGIRAP